MKDCHSAELEEIRQIQADLRWKLSSVDRRIKDLELKMVVHTVEEVPEKAGSSTERPQAAKARTSPVLPPALPPVAEPWKLPLLEADDAFKASHIRKAMEEADINNPAASDMPPPLPGDSMELRVGRVWLVRAGIVILLTGLVFLGNFAWQEFVLKVGAAGKLGLLYLAGAALGGAGWWCRRKGGGLRAYGNVLSGGGIAAIYYATYAAHFVEPLRVITNPLVGGGLLLAVAGAILWIADRKNMQAVATITTALGFYTAAINPIAGFSLFSNLVLSGVAILLLVRRKWVVVPFVSLLGCFLGFAFWRFFHSGTLLPFQAPTELDFWMGILFPTCYWIVFSVATFVGKAENFSGPVRAAFLTINNGAFYGLTAPLVAGTQDQFFWIFTSGFGVLLVLLALIARRVDVNDNGFDGSYLTQGLSLIVLGLVFKLSGYQAAILFSLQSAAFMKMSLLRHGKILQNFSGVAALVAAYWALQSLSTQASHASLAASGCAVVLLGTAWIFKNQRGLLQPLSLQKRAAGFVGIASVLGIATAAYATDGTQTVYILLAVSVSAALTLPWLRLPEAIYAAQVFVALGFLKYLALPNLADPLPCLVMVAASLFHLHWWQHRLIPGTGGTLLACWSGFHSILITGSLIAWTYNALVPAVQIPVFAALGLIVFTYGFLTRVGVLAVISQVLVAATLLRFFSLLIDGIPWIFPASAFLLLALQSAASSWLHSRLPEIPGQFLSTHRRAVEVIALVGGTLLLFQNVTEPWLFLSLTGAGFLIFCTSAVLKNSVPLHYAAFLGLFAGFQFLRQIASPGNPTWQDFAGVIMLLISQQIGLRYLHGMTLYSRRIENISIAVGILGLWVMVGELVAASAQGFFLTVSWAVVAAFSMALGFVLKERAYRWAGLVLLCLSVGRIVIVDVWQLETIYRILSFLVLGGILVAIGFLYNRFADALRKWM